MEELLSLPVITWKSLCRTCLKLSKKRSTATLIFLRGTKRDTQKLHALEAGWWLISGVWAMGRVLLVHQA